MEPTPDALPPEIRSHTLFEDAQAIFTGALFVSLALMLFGECGLLTGGTLAGAGIVADSDPEREWEETRHKAAGLLQAAV